MTTTRLRRSFKYPSDADLDIPPDIDTDQQDALIAQLRAQDTSTTAFYRSCFLALPFLAALPLLYHLIQSPSLHVILALSSLALSAWGVYTVPVGSSGAEKERAKTGGPLDRWLVVLNGLLAGVVAVGGLVAARKQERQQEGVLAVLPLVIYVAVLIGRSQLDMVDVDGLANLRYDYKGA